MATYVNNLRLKEIATGAESGTWGTSTNTNLELIGQAVGYGTEAITTNADTHASTVADGSADEARAMYIKYTGTLDSACTITIGPNTLKRVHIIENATSGSQNIIIKQGSGNEVTIVPNEIRMVYLDGAGAGAAVQDAGISSSAATTGKAIAMAMVFG
jgi:ABC-type Fe3+-hydroxamate transport system substrate-binding protein